MRTRGWLLLSTTAVAAAAAAAASAASKGGPAGAGAAANNRRGRAPAAPKAQGQTPPPSLLEQEDDLQQSPPSPLPSPALVEEYLPMVLEDIQRLDAELDRELAGLFGELDGGGGGNGGQGGMGVGPAPSPAQQEAQAAAAHKAISDVRGGGGLRQQLRRPGADEGEEDWAGQQQRAWERQSRLMDEMEEEVLGMVAMEEEDDEGEDGDDDDAAQQGFFGRRSAPYGLQAEADEDEDEEEEEQEEEEKEKEGFLFMASTERIYEGPSARSKRRRREAAAAAAAVMGRGRASRLSLEDDEEEEDEGGFVVEEERPRRKGTKHGRRARKAAAAAAAAGKRRRRERRERKKARLAAKRLVRQEEEGMEGDEEEEEAVMRPAATTTLLPPLGVWGTGATAVSALGWAALACRLLQKEGGLSSALHYILNPFHAMGSLTIPPAVAFAQAGRAHLRLLRHQPLHHQLGPFHRALLRAAVVGSALYAAAGLGIMSQARPLAALVALGTIGLLQAAPHIAPQPQHGQQQGQQSAGARSPLALVAGGLLWAVLTVALPFSLTDTPAPLGAFLPTTAADAAAATPALARRTLRRVACLGAAAGMGQMAAACFRDAVAMGGEEDRGRGAGAAVALPGGKPRRAAARRAGALAVGSALALGGAGLGPGVVAAAGAHAALVAWLLGQGADGALARGLAELQGAGLLAAVVVGEAGLLFPQAKTEGEFARAVTELVKRAGREKQQPPQQPQRGDDPAEAAAVVMPVVVEAEGEMEAAAAAPPQAPDAPPARPSREQSPLKLPLETYLG